VTVTCREDFRRVTTSPCDGTEETNRLWHLAHVSAASMRSRDQTACCRATERTRGTAPSSAPFVLVVEDVLKEVHLAAKERERPGRFELRSRPRIGSPAARTAFWPRRRRLPSSRGAAARPQADALSSTSDRSRSTMWSQSCAVFQSKQSVEASGAVARSVRTKSIRSSGT